MSMPFSQTAVPPALAEFRRRLAADDTEAAVAALQQRAGEPVCEAVLREWWLGEGRVDRARPLLDRLAQHEDVEGWVSRSALALLGGDPGRAIAAAQTALRLAPGHAAACNHIGRALFNAGRETEAGPCFEQALRLDPEYPQAWHNLGHWQRAVGRLDAAVSSYGRALALAPGYLSARFNRGICHALAERPAEALADFEAVLARAPEHLEARINAGLARHALGQTEAAEADYRAVLDRAPDHALAWTYLGVLCNEQLRHREAIEALERALALDPEEIDARRELADVYEKANRLDRAEAVLAPVLAGAAEHPGVAIDAARLRRRRGDPNAALALLGRFDPRALPQRLALDHLYELGQALDRAGRHDQALNAFVEANRLAAASPRRAGIDCQAFPREVQGILDWLRRDAPGIVPDPAADKGGDLCFMIGFPRCGTTLLDTILNAADGVATLDERPTFERARSALEPDGRPYRQAQTPQSPERAAAFRSAYRRVVAAELGDRQARLVVDKLPLRLLHAGLLAQAFPRARFVFSLRHPADVVLSNLMQNYVPNEAYVHFDTLADTVRCYVEVMRLWLELRPRLAGRLHTVRYEALVADPTGEIGAACAFLGLDFDPAMLDPEKRLQGRERVRTNSYQQVAEPIYTRSAGRWRHYREALLPFRDQLAPFLEEFGYTMD